MRGVVYFTLIFSILPAAFPERLLAPERYVPGPRRFFNAMVLLLKVGRGLMPPVAVPHF